MWAFEYLVTEAESVSFICLAGDVFDVRKPPSEVIRFFREQAAAVCDKGLDLYFIQGQHCMADPPWPISAHSCPVHLNEKAVELPNGMLMYGLDWTPGDKLASKLKAIPSNCDLFVCHQVWMELMGALRPCEGSFTQIPYAKTVFTGDYHERKVLKLIGESGQDLTVYSPGSTNMRKIDEPTKKYYYLLREDGSWTHHEIPTRPVITETIADDDDLEQFVDTWKDRLSGLDVDELPGHLQKPMLWLKFYDNVEGALRRVQDAVGNTAFLFPKLLVRESEDEAISLEREERERVIEAGLAGCLKLLVPEDNEHYQVLYRLLESKDPAAELQMLRQERLTVEEADAA
jgi:DNA repair exonuclease SbcCD nuclease subunit